MTLVCVLYVLCVCVCVLGAARLAVVLHPGDGGLAEEAVLVVHQMLVDAGSADTHREHILVLVLVLFTELRLITLTLKYRNSEQTADSETSPQVQ